MQHASTVSYFYSTLTTWLQTTLESRLTTCQLPIEGLRERTEYIDIFLFFRPSLNRVLFPMFCLLVEGYCQILVF